MMCYKVQAMAMATVAASSAIARLHSQSVSCFVLNLSCRSDKFEIAQAHKLHCVIEVEAPFFNCETIRQDIFMQPMDLAGSAARFMFYDIIKVSLRVS